MENDTVCELTSKYLIIFIGRIMNFAESEREFDSMDGFTGITTESFIERVHRIPPQFALRIHFAGKRKSPLGRGKLDIFPLRPLRFFASLRLKKEH